MKNGLCLAIYIWMVAPFMKGTRRYFFFAVHVEWSIINRFLSDVYSYDEDDMVLDSKLAEHLTHFGIDMMTMEKVSH